MKSTIANGFLCFLIVLSVVLGFVVCGGVLDKFLKGF